MNDTGIKNAKIDGTELGITDRGESFWIQLDYGDSSHQGFGGYRLGGKFTNYVILGILNAVGADSWEKLKGTPVRAKVEDGMVRAIGHYLDEKWFDPREFKE